MAEKIIIYVDGADKTKIQLLAQAQGQKISAFMRAVVKRVLVEDREGGK